MPALQVQQCAAELQPVFASIDALVGHNLRRVQAALRRGRVGPHHFGGSTGYGHGDLGRATLDQVREKFSLCMWGAETSECNWPQFFCGPCLCCVGHEPRGWAQDCFAKPEILRDVLPKHGDDVGCI